MFLSVGVCDYEEGKKKVENATDIYTFPVPSVMYQVFVCLVVGVGGGLPSKDGANHMFCYPNEKQTSPSCLAFHLAIHPSRPLNFQY